MSGFIYGGSRRKLLQVPSEEDFNGTWSEGFDWGSWLVRSTPDCNPGDALVAAALLQEEYGHRGLGMWKSWLAESDGRWDMYDLDQTWASVFWGSERWSWRWRGGDSHGPYPFHSKIRGYPSVRKHSLSNYGSRGRRGGTMLYAADGRELCHVDLVDHTSGYRGATSTKKFQGLRYTVQRRDERPTGRWTRYVPSSGENEECQPGDQRARQEMESRCLACDGVIDSLNINHRLAIRFGGPAWEEDNLESMCQACHDSHTAADSARLVELARLPRVRIKRDLESPPILAAACWQRTSTDTWLKLGRPAEGAGIPPIERLLRVRLPTKEVAKQSLFIRTTEVLPGTRAFRIAEIDIRFIHDGIRQLDHRTYKGYGE